LTEAAAFQKKFFSFFSVAADRPGEGLSAGLIACISRGEQDLFALFHLCIRIFQDVSEAEDIEKPRFFPLTGIVRLRLHGPCQHG